MQIELGRRLEAGIVPPLIRSCQPINLPSPGEWLIPGGGSAVASSQRSLAATAAWVGGPSAALQLSCHLCSSAVEPMQPGTGDRQQLSRCSAALTAPNCPATNVVSLFQGQRRRRSRRRRRRRRRGRRRRKITFGQFSRGTVDPCGLPGGQSAERPFPQGPSALGLTAWH